MINETEAASSSASEMENVLVEEKSLSNVNQSLGEIRESPIKLYSIASHNKQAMRKRILLQINDKFHKEISKALKIDEESGSEEDCTEVEEYQELLHNMIAKMKNKIQSDSSTRAEIVQVLMMAPDTWSIKKVTKVFQVSERMARQLEMTSGICSLPPPRKGKLISDDAIEIVTQFYQSNENSRIMPGIKDRISVKMNVY